MRFYIVDAFSNVSFKGNPAAVVLVDKTLDQSQYLEISAEFNLSETAFVSCDGNNFDRCNHFNLRWFTPTCEVNLCGHATLATAATLAHIGNRQPMLNFSTKSGLLQTTMLENENVWNMKFPSYMPYNVTSDVSKFENILKYFTTCGLGEKEIFEIYHSIETKKLYLRLNDDLSDSIITKLHVDSKTLLKTHDGSLVKGVSVTKKSDGLFDFVSRYFAPWNGIDEDPVNGSSHTNLTPLWGHIFEKNKLTAEMLSKRGGLLFLENHGVDSNGKGSVLIGGQAYISMSGNTHFKTRGIN